MTTKISIENLPESNGDVVIKGYNTCEGTISKVLFPGEKCEIWITNQSAFFITETWPTKKPVPVAVDPTPPASA